MKTDWNNKEEYLRFVQEWKAVYKALSAHIRGERRDGRIGASLAAGGGKSVRFPLETSETLSFRSAERSKSFGVISEALGGRVWNLSGEATRLLELRKEQKVLAGEARAAALALAWAEAVGAC